ncbi:type II secretion system protein GspM [Novosphingobium huizhouense]|uniref:type II secretion system protein GspM n=2 Tax=Novosphingobium huizhouense TaxID=2866625 RepID=UPI001CD83F12|nr:type II secretion system protein GspM [Novosphingobium huizhouense]
MRQMSTRERRLVAVLILVVAVAGVLALLVTPIIEGFSSRDRQRQMLAQVFHANERRIAAVGVLQHEAEAQQTEMRRRFMVAPDADEANEMLRARIEAAVIATGGDVKASEGIPGETDGAHAAVDARMPHGQLPRLLELVNQMRPAVAVDAMTIIADEALGNAKSDVIDVRLEASAPFLNP